MRIDEIKKYQNKDLVLSINQGYDKKLAGFNIDDWEEFIDRLCENRIYQKESIRNAIIFLLGGRYKNTEDLVRENYEKNAELKDKYKNINEYLEELEIQDKLFANIDLATGTGKSFVIYGIAQIMLGTGFVDRVLVLCPSRTIESGLKEKFESLSGDKNLKNSIPKTAKIKNPRIIDANSTIRKGDICIENIHAVYERTGSSIQDSLIGKGDKVLVLNDESHHIFNGNKDKDIKKWKEFLIDTKYNFKYILGFTGTAYVENNYFNDVIYRYSLRQAIEDGVIKNIEYLYEDDGKDKFQKVYLNHKRNIKNYPKIKPITILVTKDINTANDLMEDFINFLCKIENKKKDDIEKKVLIVTSDKNHQKNLLKLKNVDDVKNKVEYIVSVSMLTEGWDVKNVLQIYPHEERAFNSKLLISQVLGRGLRLPKEYQNPQPKVIVFNHSSWSSKIKSLIDEILEVEIRFNSEILKTGIRDKYNFELYNINYTKKDNVIEHKKTKELNFSNIEKNGIKLSSQEKNIKSTTSYLSIDSDSKREEKYVIINDQYNVDDIVDQIYNDFKTRDWEGRILKLSKDKYTQNKLPPLQKIKDIIVLSLKKANIKSLELNSENRKRILQAFSTLLRKSNKSVNIESVANNLVSIKTTSMEKETTGIRMLNEDTTMFYSDEYKKEILDNKQKELIIELIKNKDELKGSALQEVPIFNFKTPLNIVFTYKRPEREFVRKLLDSDYLSNIDSWVKSRDKNFYSIEYTIRKNNHQYSNQRFNPDFFIKCNINKKNYILVVETKADGDYSEENKAKYKYSVEHFKNLNAKLKQKNINQIYLFNFLSPQDYPIYFEQIENGNIIKGFTSDLDIELQK